MAQLNSEKVLANLLGDVISLSDAKLPLADQPPELFPQAYQRCSEWLKDPTNRLTLRYVDQSSWPGVINAAINANQSTIEGTEYHHLSQRINRNESGIIFNSLHNKITDTEQEFNRINNSINVESDYQKIKVFSSCSSLISITEDTVSIFENGKHLRIGRNISESKFSLLLNRIADRASDGYQGVLTAIAEFDAWHQEKFSAKALYTNFIDPQEQLKNLKLALLATQYQFNSLPELSTFKLNLASQPMVDLQEFQAAPVREYRKLGLSRVKVADIIALKPEGKGWDLEDRGPDYIFKMAEAIVAGDFIPTYPKQLSSPTNDNGVVLEKRGNYYGITVNGRHRVAALKGMDPELTVWAEVTEALI